MGRSASLMSMWCQRRSRRMCCVSEGKPRMKAEQCGTLTAVCH